MIADINVPWPVTANWLLGFIGFLFVAYLALGVASQARKIWGRKPPIDEDMRRLERSFKDEIKGQTEILTKTMGDLREKTEDEIADLKMSRERNWNELTREITELKIQVASIRGTLERRHRLP